jgi:thiol-disulfide isomerase/thioredoxin
MTQPSKYRTLIADDEQPARDRLKKLLPKFSFQIGLNGYLYRFSYFLFLSFLLFNNCGKRLDKIPDDFIGNFYDKSGKEYWAFGVQTNFLITESQFWEYEKIKSDKNTVSFWLKNRDFAKRLDLVKTDSLNFDFIENDKIIHCSKKADSIKRIAKNNPFSMDSGKVVIRGYIRNAEKYFKTDSKIEFIFSNEVIRTTESEFADIDSLGRFEINIKVHHAASCLLKYRNHLKDIFVSPGDQLMISTDADSFNILDFMGPHSDVCYDIIQTNEANQDLESGIQRNSAYAKNSTEFKSYKTLIRQKQDVLLRNYLKENSCSDAFRIWREKSNQNEYYKELMRYSWNRFGKGSEKSMSYMDPYFSFIDSINLNDSIAPICYNYMFFSGELYNKLNYRDSIFCNFLKKGLSNKGAGEKLRNKHPELTAGEIGSELFKLSFNKQFNVILSKEQTRFRDLRLTMLLSDYMRARHYVGIDHIFNSIKTEIKYKPYLNAITEHYNNFKKKEEAFKNTPISVMKSSGKGDELLKEIVQKHKNRVIVLDFWYTGCGACRRDFESMKTIKKDLVSEDVDFVYLCYSSTENDWKNVLKEFNIKGDHYLLTSEQVSCFSKLFDISSAPRYILINKEGRIVNSNFRPPMEANGYLNALKNNLMKQVKIN